MQSSKHFNKLNHNPINSMKKGISILKAFTFLVITVIGVLFFNQSALASKVVTQDKMLSIGDHALHSITLGKGEFTVIFESGFGTDLSHWRKVAPMISQQAKVLVYSRAGYGKSDPVSKARTLTETADELEQLINAANLKPPFIFVGHSYGGHIIRTFAAQHPNTVAGLVFVDPANEALMLELKKIDKVKTEEFLTTYEQLIPEKFRAENKLLMAIDEKGSLPDFGPLPDVPAVVLTSMVQEYPQFFIHSAAGKKVWRQLHNNLFNQFTTAQHITTINSGHNIALQEPELVIEAIEKVLKQASKISQDKRLTMAIDDAKKLINKQDLKQAETVIFNALNNSELDEGKINSIGYQYLASKHKTTLNNALATLIFKYNVVNSPNSANAFDSYGESLLAFNEPVKAKQQFLKALTLIANKSNNAQSIKGFKANLAKAELAIKAQDK